MVHPVHLGPRDLALLRLLDLTPATTAHILRASVTFPGEPFRDDRRVRERLQSLGDAGYLARFPAAIEGGGVRPYFRLTLTGYRTLHTENESSVGKSVGAEIAPSRFRHAMATADVIVHSLVAAHAAHIRILQVHGDGQLRLELGTHRQDPDCHFQFEQSGRLFNVLFEIDNATEPLDSPREQSLRTKLLGYEAYQDWVLGVWRENGQSGPRPLFRVVFLTLGVDRANHILWLARQCAKNSDRRLAYATTQDTYLGEPRSLTTPFLNDHHGQWQSLVDLYPSAPVLRAPIRLSPPLASRRGV